MADTSPPEEPLAEPRPFTGFLQEQRRGALHADLTDALAEVVNAAVGTAKAGKLTLTLTVKPTGDGMVQINDAIKVTKPEGEKGASIFYVTENGSVSRNDPRQMSMLAGVQSITDKKAAGE